MKAILVDRNKSLVWTEVDNPKVGEADVLVEIHYAALNRADLMQREGNYPPPKGCPEWMGLEVAGKVIEMGKEAREKAKFKLGDFVCALLGGGGYAEYVTVRYDMLMPVPKGVSLVEAAAMPEAFATAYLNLFIEGEAKPGETLLMNAGASGLASVVIPMAKAFGLRVITTVLSDEIADSIKHLKADRIVVTSHQNLPQVMAEEKESGHGVNLAIDCLGGEIVARCIPHMEREGRWIIIATLAGDIAPIDLRALYMNAGRVIGNTLRARTPEMKAHILASLVEKVWPKVEAGEIRPTIFKVLPIQQAEEAHMLLLNGKNVGKVVLRIK